MVVDLIKNIFTGNALRQLNRKMKLQGLPRRQGRYVLWKADAKWAYYRHLTKNRVVKVAL